MAYSHYSVIYPIDVVILSIGIKTNIYLTKLIWLCKLIKTATHTDRERESWREKENEKEIERRAYNILEFELKFGGAEHLWGVFGFLGPQQIVCLTDKCSTKFLLRTNRRDGR